MGGEGGEGGVTKNQYIGGPALKGRLGQLADLRGGGLPKKGGVFLRGVDTLMHNMGMGK